MHEGKVHIKKKGRFYKFLDNGKVVITDFWGVKGDLFQRRKVDLSLVFAKLARCFKKWENYFSVLKNKTKTKTKKTR